MLTKRITMSMLAQELGTTVTAVSRAFTPGARIKEEKRQMILKRAAELGFEPNEGASRLAQARLRLVAVISNVFPEYNENLVAGIQAAQRELAGYKVDCELIRPSCQNTREEWAALLTRLYDAGYDGVLYSGPTNGVCKAPLKRLAETVPVALLGNGAPVPCAFVSRNNTEMAGHMAAQMMDALVHGNSRRVLVFAGDLTSDNQQQLVGAFCRHATGYGLEVLPPVDTVQFAEGTVGAVRELLEPENLPDGIYVSTADCLPVCEAVASMPGPRLVTSDIFEEMCPYFENGVINASIYQDPFAQAHDAMHQLYRLLARREAPEDPLLARPQIILKSNLALFPKPRKHQEKETL